MVPLVPNAHSAEDTLEPRWARWKAAAAVQDRLWHRRATVAATAVAVAGTAALGLAIYWR